MSMKSLSISLVILVVAIEASVTAYWFGFQKGSAFAIDMAIGKDARLVQSHLQTLEHLRAGEIEKSIELLESGLDDQLILFAPEEAYTGLSESSKAEVKHAIHEASKYRKQYPRKSDRPHVDSMIEDVLQP